MIDLLCCGKAAHGDEDVLKTHQVFRAQDKPIKHPLPLQWSESEQLQPRAVGAAKLVVRSDQGITRITDLRQSGSLKLVFPTKHGPDMESVIVNTAGGVTGGDRIDITAEILSDASLTFTTQAAERAYRAQIGEVAHMTTNLTVGSNACLNWLPQELILFDNSALIRRLTIDLAESADLLMVEPLVFGRAAMGEKLSAITFNDRISIRRGGSPVYLDGMALSGDATSHLARPAIADGAGAMASLVFVTKDAALHLPHVRALLPKTGGASLLANDILVMRLLAADGYEMRCSLIPILEHLTHNSLPMSWRL